MNPKLEEAKTQILIELKTAFFLRKIGDCSTCFHKAVDRALNKFGEYEKEVEEILKSGGR